MPLAQSYRPCATLNAMAVARAAKLREEIRAKLEADLTSSRLETDARMGMAKPTPATAPAAAKAPAPGATRFGATQTCPSCGGTGRGTFSPTCGTCSGTGLIGTY